MIGRVYRLIAQRCRVINVTIAICIMQVSTSGAATRIRSTYHTAFVDVQTRPYLSCHMRIPREGAVIVLDKHPGELHCHSSSQLSPFHYPTRQLLAQLDLRGQFRCEAGWIPSALLGGRISSVRARLLSRRSGDRLCPDRGLATGMPAPVV